MWNSKSNGQFGLPRKKLLISLIFWWWCCCRICYSIGNQVVLTCKMHPFIYEWAVRLNMYDTLETIFFLVDISPLSSSYSYSGYAFTSLYHMNQWEGKRQMFIKFTHTQTLSIKMAMWRFSRLREESTSTNRHKWILELCDWLQKWTNNKKDKCRTINTKYIADCFFFSCFISNMNENVCKILRSI